MPHPWPPSDRTNWSSRDSDDARTAHSYAYESLRAKIPSGELPPGTALIQANLAKDLGVSMTPVREALRNLATEGLVTMSTHRGATVTQLDIDDAKEIYRIRLQLEPSAVSMAVLQADSDLLTEPRSSSTGWRRRRAPSGSRPSGVPRAPGHAGQLARAAQHPAVAP